MIKFKLDSFRIILISSNISKPISIKHTPLFDKPLKDISHLMNEPQKFALIKLDKVRGNACVSRRQIVSSNKREDKAKIIEKFKVGDIIKDAVVKGYSSFGCFFEVNNEDYLSLSIS